jgi:DNA-binding transcriptional regulator YiaG
MRKRDMRDWVHGKLEGKKLQAFRRHRLKLSQNDLAGCLGVSVRTVQGWEIGKSKPLEPIVRLIKLMDLFPSVREALCPRRSEPD